MMTEAGTVTIESVNEAVMRAAGYPECGIRFLDRREQESWLSWAEVYYRASRAAGGLCALGVRRGQTVGLVYPTGEEFFVAFFGVLLAGAVPVPLYPPVRLGRWREYQHRTAHMLSAAGVRLVLASSGLRRILGEALAEANCRALTLARLPRAAMLSEKVGPDALALVQFSSGTTVDPKPVALTHQAVMAQTSMLNGLWPDRPGLRHTGVSWLPLYHDMGLIGCVLPVLERPSVLTLIPPEAFVARPAIWLRAISRYRATISPAPNFAYGLCTEKIRDWELEGVDLSSWRVALNGAETVVPSVLRAFSNRFASWGFRSEALTPVYGLSEAALAVTFSAIDRPFRSRSFVRRALGTDAKTTRSMASADPNGRELVSVGQPLDGFEVEVRDRAGAKLSSGRVGRIWVRGPSLMVGYLNQPRATERTLRDGWLDTGDLGFFHQGELYITGRANDVLIVRGSNHAPEEIESVVNRLEQVRTGCSAAVSHMPAGADREQVWLFVERQRGLSASGDSHLVESCRRRVLARTGIGLDRVEVLEPGTLPRTSSGKIRRQETLRRYLKGELHPPDPVSAARLLGAAGRSMMAQLRRKGGSSIEDAGSTG